MATRLKKGITVYKKVYAGKPVCGIIGCRQTTCKTSAIATLFLRKGTLVRLVPGPHNATEKNRASSALVKSIVSIGKDKSFRHGRSNYENSFLYTVGKTAKPDSFDTGTAECSGGIHFFLDREEAVSYS